MTLNLAKRKRGVTGKKKAGGAARAPGLTFEPVAAYGLV
jgi:hypothetical protein